MTNTNEFLTPTGKWIVGGLVMAIFAILMSIGSYKWSATDNIIHENRALITNNTIEISRQNEKLEAITTGMESYTEVIIELNKTVADLKIAVAELTVAVESLKREVRELADDLDQVKAKVNQLDAAISR